MKDFTWTQNDKAVVIKIPVPSVSHENADIFTTESYIKIHFSPFLFEIFLLHDVNNDKSKCVVKDDLITIDLCKLEEMQWEKLEKDLTKAEKKEMREEILNKSIEKAKQEAEDRRIRKTQLDRFTVQQAMDIDAKQHDLMETRRDAERNTAMNALEEWRVNVADGKTSTNIKDIPKENSNFSVKIVEQKDEVFKENNNTGIKIVELKEEDNKKSGVQVTELSSGEVFENQASGDFKTPRPAKKPARRQVKTPVRSEYVEKKKEEASKRVLPRLRASGQLEITHTPRTFPTPSRESTNDEEQAWLKNVTMARRATGKNLKFLLIGLQIRLV